MACPRVSRHGRLFLHKGVRAKTRLRRSMGEGTGVRARLRTTKGNEEASETRK